MALNIRLLVVFTAVISLSLVQCLSSWGEGSGDNENEISASFDESRYWSFDAFNDNFDPAFNEVIFKPKSFKVPPKQKINPDSTEQYIINKKLDILSENVNHLLKVLRIPSSCAEINEIYSGVRRIQPNEKGSFEAYCDQDYEDGGWTVIQNRFDGSVDFYRGWKEYEQGFGDLRGEFWLGLKQIWQMTTSRPHELHVILEDDEGQVVVAKYSHFVLGGPEVKYELVEVGNFSGTEAGDALSDFVGMKFTTKDSDNDVRDYGNCAEDFHGAWWYKTCHLGNLNGIYAPGWSQEYANMICWYPFRGHSYGMRSTRMMIRPTKKAVK